MVRAPAAPRELPADAGQGDAGQVDAEPHDAGQLPDEAKQVPAPNTPELEPNPEKPNGETVEHEPDSLVTPDAVRFEPASRGFTERLELQLSAGDPETAVHYTLDGSFPTSRSPRAEGPITIDATRLVRAVAVRGERTSQVRNESYFKLASDLEGFSSNLPIIIAHTFDAAAPSPDERTYVPGAFALFTPDASDGRTRLSSAANHASRFGIKVRGRTSRFMAKRSYTFELWGQQREDAPASLLGLPADGDWVLYAPYDQERSLVRNAFGYDLSRRIGRYAPRTRFCELFVVHQAGDVSQSHYAGVYVLTERVTRSPDRVAIEPLRRTHNSEPELTGGYIMKIDVADYPGESFSAADAEFVPIDPDADEITPDQLRYIQDYLDAVMRAAKAEDGRDPQPGPYEGVRFDALIDVDSFIDLHILSMFMKNPDAFEVSTNMYKDRGGKLFAGPLWDLDLTMGAYDGWNRSVDPKFWGPGAESTLFHRKLWGPLFKHQDFTARYWARWREVLDGELRPERMRATLDGYGAELAEAAVRNAARWEPVYPAPISGRTILESHAAEIAFLQTWLEQRAMWVRGNLDVVP